MEGKQIFFINNLELRNRIKRDLTNSSNKPVENKLGLVRKKLIRKKPIHDSHVNINETVNTSSEASSKFKRRRRLKIKKKKIMHSFLPTTPLDNFEPKSSRSMNHSRRRVIITKKRLLKSTSEIDFKGGSYTNQQDPIEQGIIASTSYLEPIDASKTLVNVEILGNKLRSKYIQSTIRTTVSSFEDESQVNSSDSENSDVEDDFSTTQLNSDENKTESDSPLNIDNDYYDEVQESMEDYGETFTEDYDANEDENSQEDEQESSEDEYTEDHIQHVTNYEPFFPELSATFEAPVFLLKTTILSSIELQTKTIVQSRLRTYKSLITKVSGSEQTVESTSEVKPHIKTTTTIETLTRLTTLTLLDIDATSPTTENIISPNTESYQQLKDLDAASVNGERTHIDEARNYLATRVMSNGVEVIVAGDKSTIPGEPDVKRVLPSTIYKAVTLKPSTLSEYMMMLMPSDASKIRSITSSLYTNNKFVTKTCLTTFTYLTTYLESGTTTISSHEQVVSNIATEERNTAKIEATPSMGITLTQYPSLSVGVFHTTYTYLNTLVDGDQPLVITSKHTVTNTVTAPHDYLSLILPSEEVIPQKDTNTYFSNIMLTKTMQDGKQSKLVSKEGQLTQIVITESIPAKAAAFMTSYVALDDKNSIKDMNTSSTDVVKTYYVTYTYYNTLIEDGKTVIHTNISTSKDVSTQKFYLHEDNDVKPENVVIIATKTYQTTFTYFTTLLQENNDATPTVVSSHSKIIKNVATETIYPKQLNENYWKILRNELRYVDNEIKETVLLKDGQRIEVTAYKKSIEPTKVLPIQMTNQPQLLPSEKPNSGSSNPSVITGSTIIFFDDDPFSITKPTPTLSVQTTNKNKGTINSEVMKKTQTYTSSSSKIKKSKTQNIKPTKSVNTTRPNEEAENSKKKQVTKLLKPEVLESVSNNGDLLGLGSINIESLKVLTPVINAMAGLIKTNFKPKKKNNESISSITKTNKENSSSFPDDNLNRSPIYIPVGDLEVSESQNIASYDFQNVVDVKGNKVNLKKVTHETPLLNGGIPISPGEVITANSDVIVGKPGRILPRVPSIPVNEKHFTEITDLHPPLFSNFRTNRVPIHVKNDQISSLSNKDDYFGPPPPVSGKPYARGEKHKHIPLYQNEEHYRENPQKHMHIPVYQNHAHQFDYRSDYDYVKQPSIQIEIQNKYEKIYKDNLPIHTEPSPVRKHNYNIRASVIKEPILLPEVMDRSAGQPLLVNIQPSQVAFVNIPHNRTTALIYGGSTEPHRQGQYFDDPSPHSGSDNAAAENINNVIHYTLGHQLNSDQKHVEGVIKVGTQAINVQPDNPNSRIEKIHSSKPQNTYFNANNQEINIHVPPISFGMFQNDNEFNAHVINHGNDLQLHLPPIAYEVSKSNNRNENFKYIESSKNSAFKYSSPQPSNKENIKKNQEEHKEIRNKYSTLALNYKNTFGPSEQAIYYMNHSLTASQKRTNRTKTNAKIKNHRNNHLQNYNQGVTLADYMIPPTLKPKQSKPVPFHINHTIYRPPQHKSPQRQTLPQKYIPHSDTINRTNNMKFNNYGASDTNDLWVPDYDIISADGEFIQESNSRPLRPGELPHEILRLETTQPPKRMNLTSNLPNTLSNQIFKFTFENEVHQIQAPVIEDPRPFVKPEENPADQLNYVSKDFRTKDNSFNPTNIKQLLKQEAVRYNPIIEPTRYKPVSFGHTKEYYDMNPPRKSPPKNTIIPDRRKESSTKAPSQNNRPIVTSLPVNFDRDPTEKTLLGVDTIKSTQTEKPFNGTAVDYIFDTKTNIKVPIIRGEINKRPTNKSVFSETNAQVEHKDKKSNLEGSKPPTLTTTQNSFIETSSIPPIEIAMEASDPNTERLPVFNGVYVPQQVMKPPPVTTPEKEIIGMSPPPITTYKPLLKMKLKFSTHIPIIPSQVNSLKEPIKQVQRILTRIPTMKMRTRRPYLPKRTFKTTVATTQRPTTRDQPRPTHNSFNQTRSTLLSVSAATEPGISVLTLSSTTSKLKESIGDESTKTSVEATAPDNIQTNYYDFSSSRESPLYFNNTVSEHFYERNKVLVQPRPTEERTESSGNSRPGQLIPFKVAKTSLKILPTKFITHTHTLTVTITKTTVLKTPGLPPVTSTLLVTKTEKSTIVDTVTEFQTLLKPTSVVETITTTVQHGSLYPPDVYGKPYPSVQIQPTETVVGPIVTPTVNEISNENLDEFIITDTDPPNTSNESHISMEDNDTIFVVITDKKHGSIVEVPPTEEIRIRDEMLNTNKLNDLIAGVLSAHPPSIESDIPLVTDRCEPECKASRNELCQKSNGLMRCICRPGFARMFPDRPCNPTYTYLLWIELERQGRRKLIYNEHLGNSNSSEYLQLATATHEALDRMVMQSDLRDIYHGVHLKSFKPGKTGVINNFSLQLSDNTDEKRLEDIFKKYLRNNNYSLGGTELFASTQQSLKASDFDECQSSRFHDCSENSQCFNLKGTYTCSCKEGFSDLSENVIYPGRICSAELVGCEKCNYHGTCYSRGDDHVICECFQWYSGETCYMNLKVLLIGLICLGLILFVLLLICCIVTCCRQKPTPKINTGLSFFPQRVPHVSDRSTLDRRAMIRDSSSEDSRSETNSLPYIAKQKSKGPKKLHKKPLPLRRNDMKNKHSHISNEQKDRSLTVMIPRAKYHSAPPAPNMSSYTIFDASKSSASKPQNSESILLSYLDAGPSPHKAEPKRKYSSQVSESFIDEEPISRKTSGALVSAGFEVSATVINNMGTLGTTYGTEADRSENATLIQKISADLLSCAETRSQTNTLRIIEDGDLDALSNWDIEPRMMAMSETRSYEETTIPPPMKSLKYDYDTKASLHSNTHSHHHDEVAERDLGSTFLLPHTHLYKPERESDISGFESL